MGAAFTIRLPSRAVGCGPPVSAASAGPSFPALDDPIQDALIVLVKVVSCQDLPAMLGEGVDYQLDAHTRKCHGHDLSRALSSGRPQINAA